MFRHYFLIVPALAFSLPALAVESASRYLAQAKKYDAEARKHIEMAAEFAKTPKMYEQKFPFSARTPEHCRSLIEHYARKAKEARARAETLR